jgi:prepilin-type N-terminal cleavage/methylation domain-containing protein
MLSGMANHRRGVSLIELLVVVAIFAIIAVTVLPNIAATTEARRSREAARMLTSFIARAQSRALGRREWSGFTLVATNASSYGAADLFLADVPPVYRGDTVPALLTISGTGAVSRTAAWSNGSLASGSAAGVQLGDLIRFQDRDPWFEVSAVPQPLTTGSFTFRIRGDMSGAAEDAGYQSHNTPWPPAGQQMSFEILRQPVASGIPLSLPDSRVIDLYWSGYGPPQVGATAAYMPFQIAPTGTATAGASTSILYDGTGRLRQVQVKLGDGVPNRLTVTGPIFLLLGRADRAGEPNPGSFNAGDDSTGCNWQYPDSYWIGIDPFTGVAKAAECKPNPQGVTVIERLIDSQGWIRELLLTGGS